MRKVLFAAAATALLFAAVPASAQVQFGVSPYGGVEVGVGHRDGWDRGRDWRDHRRAEYAYDCPVVRERFVTPSGRVIIRTRRDCD
jgi:hypothetical protein